MWNIVTPPGPVVRTPDNTPMNEELREMSAPAEVPFWVRTSGGPTQINLTWEAMQQAEEHVRRALDVVGQQRELLGRAEGMISDIALYTGSSPLQGFIDLTFRAVQLRNSANSLYIATETLSAMLSAAHSGYRSAEDYAGRFFQLLARGGEFTLAGMHLLHPDGDQGFAYDWFATSAVIGGGFTLDYLLRTHRGVARMVRTLDAFDKNAGATAFEMGTTEQILDPQPTHQFTHRGTAQAGDYFEQMAQVPEHGDVAVTKVSRFEWIAEEFDFERYGIEEPFQGIRPDELYIVHMAGFDLDGVSPEAGRGYRSLADADRNDSQHMETTVQQALEAVDAPEGAEVVLTGFSMGGMHAINLAQEGRLDTKYTLKAVTTVGSPGRHEQMRQDVPIIHLQDGRDPVPHISGESHQNDRNRMTITYDFHNPDSQVETPAGSAHTYDHNVEAIQKLEGEGYEDFFTVEERSHLDAFRHLYSGEMETFVFDTHWERREDREMGDWVNQEGLTDMAEDELRRQVTSELREWIKETREPGGSDEIQERVRTQTQTPPEED